MLKAIFLYGFLTFFSSSQVDTAKILCVSHQFGSHMNLVHTAVEELLYRGHEVYTIFSDIMPVPTGLQEKGFKILKYHTPSGGHIMSDPHTENEVLEAVFHGGVIDHTKDALTAYGECIDMENDKVLEQQLLDLKFDMLVIDSFILTHCLLFLPLKINLPFILVNAGLEESISRVPLLPSYVPILTFPYSDNMSFKERLVNTIFLTILSVPFLSPFPPATKTELLEKYNDDPSLTTWDSVARKAQLHLATRGGILEYPVPLTPNIINIECLTCKPGKPVQTDIQELADSSVGIIVVSFGSLISKFPDETAKKFLDAFAERKEMIFWRYKAKLPGNVPANVKVMKWLPQNDLLAHPKTKLFITHSGNNGQYESVYHGVPMLAFPMSAEQPHNAHRITVHGFGLESDIKTFTVKELVEKMDAIMSDASFSMKTQHAGRIMKSSPLNAREKAAFWIEHVLEFGSDHLKSYALEMPWYSFYMFDILLFFHLLVLVIVMAMASICVFVFKKIRQSKVDKKKKKQ